jgi:hypothetical protein
VTIWRLGGDFFAKNPILFSISKVNGTPDNEVGENLSNKLQNSLSITEFCVKTIDAPTRKWEFKIENPKL